MADVTGVASARPGLGMGLQAGLQASPHTAMSARIPAVMRPGSSAATATGADEVVKLSRGVSLLAALDARLETMSGIARELRIRASADAGNEDLARMPKLYPPYPEEYKERVAYLDRLVGLGKQNDALELPADAPATESGILGISQSVADALAQQPKQGVSRNPGRFAQQFADGQA